MLLNLLDKKTNADERINTEAKLNCPVRDYLKSSKNKAGLRGIYKSVIPLLRRGGGSLEGRVLEKDEKRDEVKKERVRLRPSLKGNPRSRPC